MEKKKMKKIGFEKRMKKYLDEKNQDENKLGLKNG
jgi:hypothetical protein